MGGPSDVSAPGDRRRTELEAVLRSSLFAKAPSLCHLLSYLAARSLAGDSEQLKEYTIAVEVFGRKPEFNPDEDSIVRVEANRLRKRLKQYYETEGAGHEVRLRIPVGQYAVSFEESAHAAEAAVEKTQGATRTWLRTVPGAAWLGLLVVAAAAAVGGFYAARERAPVASESAAASEALKLPAGLPAGEEVRILCGSTKSYADRAGKTWAADQYFTGGSAVRGNVAHIQRTLDPAIYRNSRQGDFGYDIPLKPGTYELRLHFAETQYGPEAAAGGGEGSRILGVTANGEALLTQFDAASDAGGSRTADVKVFPGVQLAADGKLHLRFLSLHGARAMVSGIEVVPGARGTMRPVRLTARDTAFYSEDSRWWGPDAYFQGGQLWQHTGEVQGAIDPEFFDWERWGNFSYAIPVAPGRYRVTLWFAERNFGAANRERYSGPADLAGGGAGSRVFDVLCNGRTLLRDFDIFKEAGGENRALEKRFSGLEANAQGKLLLEFVPRRNYATVTAIEVVAEE